MLYELLVRPVLFRVDPEFVHHCTVYAGRAAGSNKVTRGALRLAYDWQHPKLRQKIAGIAFRNPVGLAAGFDKDCNLMDALPAIGFGFVEVGSITAQPYAGNPKPRLTRLPKDKSIIVYYGLKNKGAHVLRPRLERSFTIPVGVSVAKTNKEFSSEREKLDDWADGILALKDLGDYLTINISCPNTFDPANFCDPRLLEGLLRRIDKEKMRFRKPVFLKLSPDITVKQLDNILALCAPRKYITGFVLSNLVKDRSKLALKSDPKMYKDRKGGFSGKVVQPRSLELVRHAYRKAGKRFVLVGCGGIFTAQDAYEYIRSGAPLVQIITGMVYGGPATVKRINKGLVTLLERDGFSSISEAVGADVR
jgi:dihydroorotate dehydrogenase